MCTLLGIEGIWVLDTAGRRRLEVKSAERGVKSIGRKGKRESDDCDGAGR